MDELNQIQNPNVSMNNNPAMSPEKQKSWLFMAVVAIIAAGVVVWWFAGLMTVDLADQQQLVPMDQEAKSDALINAEIEGVDLGDLDKEFQTIDNDLNSL